MCDTRTRSQTFPPLPIRIGRQCLIGSLVLLLSVTGSVGAQDDTSPGQREGRVLESPRLRVEVHPATGHWVLHDRRSGVRWPTEGTASAGQFTPPLTDGFSVSETTQSESPAEHIVLTQQERGIRVAFQLVHGGGSLKIIYDGPDEATVLEDALAVTSDEQGSLILPCREGLLISADSGVAFQRAFGTSDYEGCHMNMLGALKSGSALIVGWDDAYVTPELESVPATDSSSAQRIVTRLRLRRSARAVRLTPLGPGDWNTVAAGYRTLAEQQGLAVTLDDKIRRQPHAQLLVGAANVKLWTCLARRMNEQSTQEESVKVRWTFDEAAQIAEHLHDDLDIAQCLFMLGGWTEGGYDCRHPDNLPANPECGGNPALASAISRIQQLDYVACLHDNYQDMYRDARSWNPEFIEKTVDGSLIQGGRWLGGRAYMVCAPSQLRMSMRPQNLPETQRLFRPWSYFIDTTYEVGREKTVEKNLPK